VNFILILDVSFLGGNKMTVTGLVELLNLVNISVELQKRNAKTNAKFKKSAVEIFANKTPVDTGDTLASEGDEDLIDGFTVFADIDYSLYNDQGFNHYRNGKIEGFHYSDQVVKDLEKPYLEEMQHNLSDSIEVILKRTTNSGLGFINPFTGFQGRSSYSFLFGGI
jgi:hypothetical protein